MFTNSGFFLDDDQDLTTICHTHLIICLHRYQMYQYCTLDVIKYKDTVFCCIWGCAFWPVYTADNYFLDLTFAKRLFANEFWWQLHICLDLWRRYRRHSWHRLTLIMPTVWPFSLYPFNWYSSFIDFLSINSFLFMVSIDIVSINTLSI